jgi:hypothetical protein
MPLCLDVIELKRVITEGLREISHRPRGYTHQLNILVEKLVVVDFVNDEPHVPLFSIVIYNDGPDEVYVSVNVYQKIAPLKFGEYLKIDMLSPKIEKLYLDVNEGKKAYIRVFGVY